MLIGCSGSYYSGVEELVQLLCKDYEFTHLWVGQKEENAKNDGRGFDSLDELIEYATKHYTQNYVLSRINTLEDLDKLEKRPFFLHLSIDAPLKVRFERFQQRNGVSTLLEEFIAESDQFSFYSESVNVCNKAPIKFQVTSFGSYSTKLPNALMKQLDYVTNGNDIKTVPNNTTPLRPSWDTYFMKLANLAASRSNCMKRRVGCVIVRDCRVIATGYNGTPRHLLNCNSGGCPRCNSGDSKANLHTCLCLHAEENALLEAGRDRVGSNATLYCDTCPCLTCSVKIVQTGIREVVYSQSYRMDEASFKVLQSGGVLIRQYSLLEEPRIVTV